jgi:conjugative transfer signal peptidase TraF
MQKLSTIVAIFGGSLLMLALIAKHGFGLVVNTTPSASPVGIYRPVAAPPVKGDLVQVCLPHAWAVFAQQRGYIGGGGSCPDQSMPLVKQIGAIAGEQVYVAPENTMLVDSHGRPLPHFTFGRYTVPVGMVWLHGNDPKSFDSRYYGIVPEENVLSVLKPLVTW